VHYIQFPDAASDSDSDESDFIMGDNVIVDEFKPVSFSLETEADVAMDMD
jgi:hypothetical protein